MKSKYIEGEYLEFTPSVYLARFILGIVFAACGLVGYLLPCIFDNSVSGLKLLLLTLVFLIVEIIVSYYIYYGVIGRRSRIKFTRTGLTVVNPDQTVREFLWSDFEKAYMMGASSQYAFIVSTRKITWKERKRAVAHAGNFPVIIHNDIIVVWCTEEHEKIETMLDGILPVIEDYYYISPGIDKNTGDGSVC